MATVWKVEINHSHTELFRYILPTRFSPNMTASREAEGNFSDALVMLVLGLTGSFTGMLSTGE